MIKNPIKKLYIKKFFLILLFLFFISCNQSKENNNENLNEKVVIKVFSSLTCPHCANFHEEIILKIKDDYLDTNLVKFEHHAFPLDLAALNAEVVVRCQTDIDKKFKLLEKIYEKQKSWAIGSDINKINKLLNLFEKI